MSGKQLVVAVVVAIVLALFAGSVYTVDERERAIVFQFGRIIKTDNEAGLKFKMPFVQSVRKFDGRIQTMDAAAESYLTIEKKNLDVDSFVKWRIRDVAKYYVTVSGSKRNAESRLAQRVNDSLRREFSKRTVQRVISGDRAEIMDVVREAVNEEASQIGIEVVDVRLKRVDLDKEISESVYGRMEAERSRVATELRAQGEEAAERIRADADRQAQILLANAQRDGEKLRGDGDAQATKIYAKAFNRDREFYRLYRSLNAYKDSFDSKSDILVIEPDSEFFKYFKQSRPTS
ncbi:MAG: protease modulator HflC [Arenicellales bacterium WSBS_2016_MAG_OTU3]